MQRYDHKSSYAKNNAQLNLQGRSHYAEDDTLKWFFARILNSSASHDGLIFWLIESVALDMHNRSRGFRYVVFDLAGNVISRCDLKDAFKTSNKAYKALQEYLATIDAVAITEEAIKRQEKTYAYEIKEMREILDQYQKKRKVA